MKKISRKGIKNKLDKLFSEKVRSIGHCEYCGSTNNLQCAHIFSRKNLIIRWDFDNAVCLCLKHHLYWAHKEPIEFSDWLEKYKGELFMSRLRGKLIMAEPIKLYQLIELYDKLSKEAHLED